MKTYGTIGIGNALASAEFDPVRGDRWTVHLEGTHPYIRGWQAKFRAEQIEHTADYRNPIATLEARFSYRLDGSSVDAQVDAQGANENTWELDELDDQRSLWEHPKVLAVTNGLSTGGKRNLRHDIEALVSGTITYEEATYLIQFELAYPDMSEFIGRRLADISSYENTLHVLRNVQRWPGTYRYTPHFTSAGKQISSALLQSQEPTIPFTLPEAKYWQRRGQRISQLTDGRIELVQQWWEMRQDTWVYEQTT